MGVTLQGLVLGFWILIRDPLAATHRDQGFENGVMGGAGAVEQLGRRVAALLGYGKQQVLGGDELVLETAGFVEGALENLVQRL